MRTRKALVLALLLAVSATGCGAADDGSGVATAGGRGKPTKAAADTLSDEERAIKFAECMRKNGVPDFPDPDTEGGGMRIRVPQGADREKVDAAMRTCKEHLPNGGEPPRMDAQRLEQMRKYANCMRENGVPKFPDPEPDGGMRLNRGELGIDPNSEEFKAAQRACAKHRPAPPSGAAQRGGNG